MVKRHISQVPPRREDTHKGDFGHVLVVAGSRGMTGAASLASRAALLAGSGLVTCGVPESLNAIMEVKLTEAMTLALPETKEATLALKAAEKIVKFSEKADAVALGPGVSRQKDTQKLIRGLLLKIKKPLVLDADGIVALSDNPNILKRRAQPTVLTPHPGEMSRLTGKSVRAVQGGRKKLAEAFAKKYNTVLVLKGYRTVIASPKGDVYVNKTGNSGMGTAGVGDVLTGIIASFIGQGIIPYSASVLGVYLHGLAGDIAAKEKGQFSLIASDLLAKLPQAIKKVL